jgi:hypothetical protein
MIIPIERDNYACLGAGVGFLIFISSMKTELGNTVLFFCLVIKDNMTI